MDGVRAGRGGVACDVGSCEAKRIADKVDEQRALLDFGACRLAVDGQGDLDGHDLTPSVKVELFLGWRSNKMQKSSYEKASLTAIHGDGFAATRGDVKPIP